MNLDRMFYLVISQLNMSGVGPIIMEVEVSRMDRAQVADDILHGQYNEVLHVIEMNPVEHVCREVTDEFTSQDNP